MSRKQIILAISLTVGLIAALILNPFSWNDAGERTVVQRMSGQQIVRFTPGVFYAGFFSKETSWPNQISVSYLDTIPNLEFVDGTIEIKRINIRFGEDATTADVSGIVQFNLPNTEDEMIRIHNAHRTPESLVTKRLAPYTKECLQSSAQLLSSEKHYSGGRAQMAQDFRDQLSNGVYLLVTKENNYYDSLTKESKRLYYSSIQIDKNGQPKRKESSIKEYGIIVTDAAITDIDYQELVDAMLAKKIESATKASVSKQDLMTAQQQMQTEAAKGEKELVETEYREKQIQTQQVVQAQTTVKLAEEDRKKQEIALKAAILEAQKIKTLADAEAYAKQRVMQADGALDKKLAAYKDVQQMWVEAFSKYTGNMVPTIIGGNGGSGNGNALNFMELITYRTMLDLNVDLKNKNNK